MINQPLIKIRSPGTPTMTSLDSCSPRSATLMKIDHKIGQQTNDEMNDGLRYVCQRLKCKKRFATREAVFEHMKEHEDAKVYICPEVGCGRKYSRLGRLKIHLKTPYRCTYEGCSKAFTERGNLVVHMRIHTGERPFACNICDKKFRAKGALTDHLRTHSGEKLVCFDLIL